MGTARIIDHITGIVNSFFLKMWIFLLTVGKVCIIIKHRKVVSAVYTHLKELRESLGMTQEEFGKSIGIAKSTYNNYEKGIREPKSDFWIAVARKYGVTIDYLMGYTNEPRGDSANPPSDSHLLTAKMKTIASEYKDIPDGDKLIEMILNMDPVNQRAALDLLIRVLTMIAWSNPPISTADMQETPPEEKEQ